MDTGIQDTSQKKIFHVTKEGRMKRDYKFEYIEKLIERRD